MIFLSLLDTAEVNFKCKQLFQLRKLLKVFFFLNGEWFLACESLAGNPVPLCYSGHCVSDIGVVGFQGLASQTTRLVPKLKAVY